MRTIFIALSMLLLFACQSVPESPEPSYITGSVSYRERMALPPDAVVKVSLQDVSLADAPAKVLASQVIERPGQVPIEFSIEYDPRVIGPNNRYAVQARIEHDGRLLFINDTHTPVLTHGGGSSIDMMLIRAAGGETESLPGTALTGMFLYFADAATFRDCRTGLSYPVAMEGGYIDLERAYLAADKKPMQELQVKVRGRLLPRPPMEGDQDRVHLIVDRFERIEPGACAPEAHATLTNTYWRLTHIDGKAVTVGEDGREPHLMLGTEDYRIRGNGGCNQFFGSYELKDGGLTFSGIGSTMMFCAEGSETERAFFGALGEVDSFAISGQVLELRTEGVTVARFEAVYH